MRNYFKVVKRESTRMKEKGGFPEESRAIYQRIQK